uniref:Interleukin 20 receptor subunit beta n=1 Tax=Sphenodon punctatus TaxID=8508 RepID=A0A8D0GFT4_SPHPU
YPALLAHEAFMPAPQNISIVSTNMKHFLTWSPVTVPGGAVRYSVEFQGEYERDYANNSWIPIGECSAIRATQCDITDDISATVPYNVRVRAVQGTQTSCWTTLNSLFNRITTSLTPPNLSAMADGHHLLVKLEHLGPAFEFWIFYWRKGQENWVRRVFSSATVHLETMEAGTEYCIRAQAYVEAINRSSDFSETQCVKAAVMSVTITLVLFAGFVVTVLTLPFLAWKICQICKYSCCPTVGMPDTLKLEFPARLLNFRGEEEESCDMAVRVLPPEELLHLWIHEAL